MLGVIITDFDNWCLKIIFNLESLARFVLLLHEENSFNLVFFHLGANPPGSKIH